jgi:WD40 repeat protein
MNDAPNFRRLGPETTYADLPTGVAFLPGSKVVAAVSANGRLRLIPIDGSKEKQVSVGKSLASPVVSPDGARIITGAACVDVRTAKKAWTPERPFLASAFSGDGTTLVVSFNFGVARVNPKTGAISDDLEATSHNHSGSIGGLAISPDARTLATGCNSGIITLTALASGKILAANTIEDSPARVAPQFSVNALAFGRSCLVAGLNGFDIRILSPENLALRRVLALPESAGGEYQSEARGLVFAQDRVTLFAACHASFPKGEYTRKDAYLMAWNVETGEVLLRCPFPHGMFVHRGIALSEDGQTVALAAHNGVYVAMLSAG